MAASRAATLGPARSLGERSLKVDHTGENSAVRIYTAQLWVARWRSPALVAQLEEFLVHEQAHRAIFAAELAARGVRRCRSYGLCGFGGTVLGLATGLIGPQAVHATTAAIERVVLRHLQHQLEDLRTIDPAACAAIGRIVADEQAHHDQAEGQVLREGALQAALDFIVSRATEMVIWLGMRN
jgi:ubiquinone biosynthesis monooxygenase Coq7